MKTETNQTCNRRKLMGQSIYYPKRKIDIFVNGHYTCSTNMSKRCKDAILRFIETHDAILLAGKKITARFDHERNLN